MAQLRRNAPKMLGCRTAQIIVYTYIYSLLRSIYLCFRLIYYLRPSFSLIPINGRTSDSDPGSHCRLFYFPPLPTTVRALHCHREKISALSSLVDSRRTLCLPTLHALSS